MPNTTRIPRIWTVRPTGLPKKLRAPFWRGETAQKIIRRRVKEYARAARVKLRARRRKAK